MKYFNILLLLLILKIFPLKTKIILYNEEENIGLLKINNSMDLINLNNEILHEFESVLNNINTNIIRVLILTNFDEEESLISQDIIGKHISSLYIEKSELEKEEIKLLNKIQEFPIPIIAALKGHIIGRFFDISLICDFRICSNNTNFGYPRLSIKKLKELINIGNAKKLVLTSQIIKANEAFRIGLVNNIYEENNLLLEAKKLANIISNNDLNAIKHCKKSIDNGIKVNIDKALTFEEKFFGDCFESSGQKERMTNFLNKNNYKNDIKNIIIKSPNKLPSKKTKWYIFLAGPIQGAPEWQNQIPNINAEVILLSPRRENYENFNYSEQVNWETISLRIADIILFWIPEEKEKIKNHEYAQTTRTEFGEYLARGKKIVIGVNNNFLGRRYIQSKCEQYGIKKLHDNLNDCIIEIEQYINQYKNQATFYTSDTHFGSERALTLSQRPFKSVKEMDWKMIEN